jgi:copper chaperone CopZ
MEEETAAVGAVSGSAVIFPADVPSNVASAIDVDVTTDIVAAEVDAINKAVPKGEGVGATTVTGRLTVVYGEAEIDVSIADDIMPAEGDSIRGATQDKLEDDCGIVATFVTDVANADPEVLLVE